MSTSRDGVVLVRVRSPDTAKLDYSFHVPTLLYY